MTELQSCKCPSCGGELEFNPHFQKMQCLYCKSDFDPNIFKELDKELDEHNAVKQEENNVFDDDEIVSYICNSCGGEIITDSITITTDCPFCGNSVVVQDRIKGVLKPDYVIPFKYDKYDAIRKYNKYISNKKLLPKIFKEQNHIDEIKGIYVPFWIFDAGLHCDVKLKAVNAAVKKDAFTKFYNDNLYTILRSADIFFEKVPVDGSKKIADELMDSIEPFNFNEMIDFQTAYLSGYIANKYDVDRKKSAKIASKIMKKSAIDTMISTTEGYADILVIDSNTKFISASAKYVFCPIWLLNTTFKNKKYTFLMNGQTGKFVGNLPINKKKYNILYFMIASFSTLLTFFGCILYHFLQLSDGEWLL